MQIKTLFGGCALAVALTVLPVPSAHAQDASSADAAQSASAATVPVGARRRDFSQSSRNSLTSQRKTAMSLCPTTRQPASAPASGFAPRP
jgi:hypothetical protein